MQKSQFSPNFSLLLHLLSLLREREKVLGDGV
jgi:hypothetical protein